MLKFSQLRSDQQSAIDELYQRSAVMVVMRMGGGKTATALTGANELINDGEVRSGIILSPPLVAASVWPREPAKWEHLQGLKVVPLVGTPAQRKKLLDVGDADLFSVSDGVVRWLVDYLATLPDDHPLLDLLIYDEPKLKNPRGAIGKALIEIAPRVKNMWKFTGTPRPNGFEDLYMPSRILSGDKLWGSDFDLWRRRNFMPMDYHGLTWKVHDFRIPELEADAAKFLVRAALPPDARTGTMDAGEEFDIHIDLPAKAMKAYKQMERDLIIEAIGDNRDPEDPLLIAALSQAAASSKLSQLAQGFMYGEEDEEQVVVEMHAAKVDALKHYLHALGAETSVLVYGFRQDLVNIKGVLDKEGRRYGVLGGGVTPKKKLATLDAWNEGRLDNLIIHPMSAGHGVEAQHGGHNLLWYCPIWSAEMYDQVNKRLDRPGQLRQVLSVQLIANRTVDLIKRNRVFYKMSDQEAFKQMLREL